METLPPSFAVSIVLGPVTYTTKFKLPITTSSTETAIEKVNKHCREEWNVIGGCTKDKNDHVVDIVEADGEYYFKGFRDLASTQGII